MVNVLHNEIKLVNIYNVTWPFPCKHRQNVYNCCRAKKNNFVYKFDHVKCSGAVD